MFSSKGRIFATVWQGQIKEAVATGTFIVLEPRSKEIIPEYLALYLNSSKAKRYFDLHLKTATVNHIGKKQLDQLEIEIPSIQKQQLLVKAYQLIVEEKNLATELVKRKEKILNTLI
ncbi:MAG: restriction endonuclease subunit S [Crocinitomicaceae bacterium]|nr:restriction endonuclease subunit S [Crocinitomicaceae bacterium]